LLSDIGYAVVFKFNGDYRVVKLGVDEGVTFPGPFEVLNSPKYTATELPTSVYVVGARVVVEERSGFLQAVMEDVDGQIKSIGDPTLSYAVSHQWTYNGFENLAGEKACFCVKNSVGSQDKNQGDLPADLISNLTIPAHIPPYTSDQVVK